MTNDPKDSPLDHRSIPVNTFFNKEMNKFAATRDLIAKQGNDTETALSSQLILVTTVLISATALALSISSTLTTAQKYIVFLIFLSLAASTLCGIFYYMANIQFFLDWARLNHKIVEYIKKRTYKTENEFEKTIDQYNQELPVEVNKVWFKAQLWLLIITFSLYGCLMVMIFFNFHFDQTILPVS